MNLKTSALDWNRATYRNDKPTRWKKEQKWDRKEYKENSLEE